MTIKELLEKDNGKTTVIVEEVELDSKEVAKFFYGLIKYMDKNIKR